MPLVLAFGKQPGDSGQGEHIGHCGSITPRSLDDL
jgi:hypothetical protein